MLTQISQFSLGKKKTHKKIWSETLTITSGAWGGGGGKGGKK